MQNYTYKWESKPTIEKSKYKGTCVTYVACVLQRLGVLKPGQILWNNGRGYGDGKVIGANDKMQVTYMNNKTIAECKSELKAGDIIIIDDNKSGKKGSGGHIFIFTGKWNSNGQPIIWDEHSSERVKAGKDGQKAYGKTRKVLARVRIIKL